MSDDLWDWADVAALDALGNRLGLSPRKLNEAYDLARRELSLVATGIRCGYEDGKRYQRSKDVAICKALSETLDPCHDVSNASDCQRAIENRLSPEEAARRVRNGESLDA